MRLAAGESSLFTLFAVSSGVDDLPVYYMITLSLVPERTFSSPPLRGPANLG